MDVIWKTDFVIAHTACLASSLKNGTGRDLMPQAANPVDLAEQVLAAPFVLVSHGTEADPTLNYGNRAALALWEV